MIEVLKAIHSKLDESQSVGIDGVTKHNFDTNLTYELETIERKILNHTYEFSYYKQLLMIKSHNKTREISIPTLRDKITINYLHTILLQKFEEQLSQLQAPHIMINDIKNSKESYNNCFLKIDIKNFYPTINHELLLEELQGKFQDEPYLLELISKAITQSTVSPKTPSNQRIKYNNKIGVPQGLSVSGTLAQIYLQNIDKKYKSNKSIKFYRFVDDILIFCNQNNLEKLQRSLKRDFKKLKLTIHTFGENLDKSTFGNIKEPFEFLGYRFIDDVITVRQSSSQKMFENLNILFAKYKNGEFSTKKTFYKKLNLKITGCVIDGKRYGWIHFFSMINDHKLLFILDRFIEKKCQKLNLDYGKIKKYARAIYEIKDENSNYVTTITNYSKKERYSLITTLKEDVEYY